MSRFLFLGHGFFLSLVLVLPLLRNAWDLWAQTLVLCAWAFWIGLGALLGWRRGARFPDLERALRGGGGLWAGIIGLSLISMGLSAHPHSAVPGALLDLSTAAFFFLGAGLSTGKRPLYIYALVGAGVLTGLVALALDGVDSAAVGVAVNPNALAAVALLALPLAAGLWAAAPSGKGRWGWGAVVGVIALTLVLSRSLVAILVMGAQAAFLLYGPGRRRRPGVLAGVGALVAVGAGMFLDRADWGKILGDPDRWSWWRTAFQMIKTHPWFGVGPGAFGEAYPLFRAENWGLNSLYAHNAVLEWTAERGILGGGLLLVWVGRVLRASRASWTSWEGRGLWAALAGVFLFNGVHIGFSFPAVLWLFALAAGLAVRGSWTGEIENTAHRRWGSLAGAAAYIAAAALLLTQWRAGQMLERGRAAFFQNDLTAARAWADRGLRWNPRSPELFALRAGTRARAADLSGARADLSAAARLAPGAAGFLMDRAELSLLLKDADAARADYVGVNRRLPLFYPAWERRGDLLISLNRPGEAGEAYRTALKALADPRTRGRGENKGRTRERLEEKIRGVNSHAAH